MRDIHDVEEVVVWHISVVPTDLHLPCNLSHEVLCVAGSPKYYVKVFRLMCMAAGAACHMLLSGPERGAPAM